VNFDDGQLYIVLVSTSTVAVLKNRFSEKVFKGFLGCLGFQVLKFF